MNRVDCFLLARPKLFATAIVLAFSLPLVVSFDIGLLLALGLTKPVAFASVAIAVALEIVCEPFLDLRPPFAWRLVVIATIGIALGYGWAVMAAYRLWWVLALSTCLFVGVEIVDLTYKERKSRSRSTHR